VWWPFCGGGGPRWARLSWCGWSVVVVRGWVWLVVLVAGYRLIVLSVQQHAQRAHQAALTQAAATAHGIELQLQSLAEAAQREAERGASMAKRA